MDSMHVEARYFDYDFDFSRIPIAWDAVQEQQVHALVAAVNAQQASDFEKMAAALADDTDDSAATAAPAAAPEQ